MGTETSAVAHEDPNQGKSHISASRFVWAAILICGETDETV